MAAFIIGITACALALTCVHSLSVARLTNATGQQLDALQPGTVKGGALIMACHHKTGTHLLHSIGHYWESKLGTQHVFSRDIRYSDPSFAPRSRLYPSMDVNVYNIIREHGYARLVHLVRDPIDTVISGYWYHLKSFDTQLVPGTGPLVLGHQSLADGLRAEARAEIASTLEEMAQTYAASGKDKRVLTLGIEDFVDNFDETTQRMYVHFAGKHDPDMKSMLAAASAADIMKNKITDAFINDRSNYVRSQTAILNDHSFPWKMVSDYRKRLGYVETSKGMFRHRDKHSTHIREAHLTLNGEESRSNASTYSSSPESTFGLAETFDQDPLAADRPWLGSDRNAE